MGINVGDLIRVKTYITKPVDVLSTSGRKNLRESPRRGHGKDDLPRAVSAYFDFEHQGKIGIVTKVDDNVDNDAMWTMPIVTILLDDDTLLRLPKDDVALITEKTHANRAEGFDE